MRHAGTAMPELPGALQALIFSRLTNASDLARAAEVCSTWRQAISGEAVSWTLVMADLDPFGALGGADGAWKLFHAAGGWLRAVSALADAAVSQDRAATGANRS
jgi:hypothetical protein